MIVTICTMTLAHLALVAQGSPQAGALGLFAPLILIMIIFYFLMIMPAQKRQKKVSQMLAALKTGDKIITNGGIFGTVVGIESDAVQLRIAEQVKIKIARNAVAGLQAEPPKES
jgi:preprotein translocase subunit YajC